MGRSMEGTPQKGTATETKATGTEENALVGALKAGADYYTDRVRRSYNDGLNSDESLSPKAERAVRAAARIVHGAERTATATRGKVDSLRDRLTRADQAREEVDAAYSGTLTMEDVVAPGAELSPNLEGYTKRTLMKINERRIKNGNIDPMSEYSKRTEAKLAELQRQRQRAERLAHGEEIRQVVTMVGDNEKPIVSPTDVSSMRDFASAMTSEAGPMLGELRDTARVASQRGRDMASRATATGKEKGRELFYRGKEKASQVGSKLKEAGKKVGERVGEKLSAVRRKAIARAVGAAAVFDVMFDGRRMQTTTEGRRGYRQQEATTRSTSTEHNVAATHEPVSGEADITETPAAPLPPELGDVVEEAEASLPEEEPEYNRTLIKLFEEKLNRYNAQIEERENQLKEATGINAPNVVDIRDMLGSRNEISELKRRRDKWQKLMDAAEDLHLEEVEELLRRQGSVSRQLGPISGSTKRAA